MSLTIDGLRLWTFSVSAHFFPFGSFSLKGYFGLLFKFSVNKSRNGSSGVILFAFSLHLNKRSGKFNLSNNSVGGHM